MALKKDMTGMKFGHLTVIRESPLKNAKGQTYWICKCDCGNLLHVRGDNLRIGNTQNCSECAYRKTGKGSNFISKEEGVFEK